MDKTSSPHGAGVMLRRAAVALVVTGAAVAAAVPALAQAVPDWAREQTRQWYGAFNAGDAAAITKLYADDAVLHLQGQVFAGRAAIAAFHKGNFEKARFACTWTIDGVRTVDTLASVWGTDTCVDTPKSGGSSQGWKGRWMSVYQRQSNGSWLIVRDSGEEIGGGRTPERRRAAVVSQRVIAYISTLMATA